MGINAQMITDKQFAEILKPLDFDYDTDHDTIYSNGGVIIAYVLCAIQAEEWERGYIVERVEAIDLDDEHTLALRAVCVLHNIEVKEFEDSDHR